MEEEEADQQAHMEAVEDQHMEAAVVGQEVPLEAAADQQAHMEAAVVGQEVPLEAAVAQEAHMEAVVAQEVHMEAVTAQEEHMEGVVPPVGERVVEAQAVKSAIQSVANLVPLVMFVRSTLKLDFGLALSMTVVEKSGITAVAPLTVVAFLKECKNLGAMLEIIRTNGDLAVNDTGLTVPIEVTENSV
ncbi:hypothetical protein B566_EDAN017036 [Ephemera danica]|nr:hypothetical protein B566_EDAN017036 [Ephemera danica]